MDTVEGVCARCGKSLGPRADWAVAWNGSAYHSWCEVPEKPEPGEDERPRETLTQRVERAAKNAMYGKGQQQLDDRGEDGGADR